METQNQQELEKTKRKAAIVKAGIMGVVGAITGGLSMGIPGAVMGGIDGLLGTNVSHIYAIANRGANRQERAFMKEVKRLGRIQSEDSRKRALKMIKAKYGKEKYNAVYNKVDAEYLSNNDSQLIRRMLDILGGM